MTDLDDALRTMLRQRAHDVDAVPSHLLRPDELAGDEVVDLAPRRRHNTIQLIAASVVAVLALAGALVGLRHLGGHGTPTGSPTSTSSTPPVEADGRECRAILPAAWRTAFTATVALGSPGSSTVLGVSDTGAALISRDVGSTHDVVLVQPGGGPATVLQVPANLEAYTGGLYGSYAVVPLYWAPNSTVTSTVMRLDVINLHTGVVTRIAGTSTAARTSGQHVVDGAVVLDGAVYYDRRTDASHGVLMKYDLRTGRTSTAYSGPVGTGGAPVRASAAGVVVADPGGGFTLRVRVSLPPAVAGRIGQSAITAGTDGTAYAWFDQLKQTINWWTPGQAVRTLRATLGQPDGDDTIPRVDVAGPYVFYSGPQLQVVDTRTGAVATLPNVVVASGGDYVGTYVTAHHSSAQAGVVDTSTLPALTC
jgi:hypothetical protein